MMWTGLEPHGWWELDLAGGVQRVTMLGCKIQSKVSGLREPRKLREHRDLCRSFRIQWFFFFFFESLLSFFVLKICDSSHHVIAPSDYRNINAGAVVFSFFGITCSRTQPAWSGFHQWNVSELDRAYWWHVVQVNCQLDLFQKKVAGVSAI